MFARVRSFFCSASSPLHSCPAFSACNDVLQWVWCVSIYQHIVVLCCLFFRCCLKKALALILSPNCFCLSFIIRVITSFCISCHVQFVKPSETVHDLSSAFSLSHFSGFHFALSFTLCLSSVVALGFITFSVFQCNERKLRENQVQNKWQEIALTFLMLLSFTLPLPLSVVRSFSYFWFRFS